jgi:hypothetical protein
MLGRGALIPVTVTSGRYGKRFALVRGVMTADYSLVVSAYGSTFFALGFVRLGRFDKAMTVEAGRFKLLPMKFCQGPSSVGGN